MNLKVLSSTEALEILKAKNYGTQKSYLAMYSTWYGGIVKDPGLMIVPVDDHLVHRGDGVFEAMKVVDGKIFLMTPHLDRLEASAKEISLSLPCSRAELEEIIKKTTLATGVQNALLRLYLARGPGGFTTNPYDSVGPQIYLIVTELKYMPAEKYEQGASIGKSAIPPKEPWLARIKTCNYLPNVLMKKESVDRKLDFTVSFDNQGYLTESSTENIVIVDKNGNLLRPKLHQILKGTTMIRSFDLAQSLLSQGTVKSIGEKDIHENDVINAREVMMIGTTLDVLPVTTYEGKAIGNGQVGAVAKALLQILREDIKKGPQSIPL
jgi:branched-chain amino acid aminotransferase